MDFRPHPIGEKRNDMGILIVIDGLDGSGKNTQSHLLAQRLEKEGKRVKLVSFPDYASPACGPVKLYLGGAFGTDPESVNCYAASSFYAVDRFASYRLDWKKDLDEGAVVIANRYTTANAIHQLAKLPPERHDEFLAWLWDFEFVKLGLPAPDRTVLLEVPVEVSLKLIEERGEQKDIHENREHLRKAYGAALEAAEKWHWSRVLCTSPDGELQSIPEIGEKLYEAVSDLL